MDDVVIDVAQNKSVTTINVMLQLLDLYRWGWESTQEKVLRSIRSSLAGHKNHLLKNFVYQTIAPYSPYQNKVVALKNRALMEMTNTILISFSLLQNFWGELLFLPNIFSMSWFKRKLMRHSINYKNVKHLLINSYKCAGVWKKKC